MTDGGDGCGVVTDGGDGCGEVTDGGDGCGVVTDGGDGCGVVTDGGDGCDVVTDLSPYCDPITQGQVDSNNYYIYPQKLYSQNSYYTLKFVCTGPTKNMSTTDYSPWL